jgi:ABC-type multidrug transport system fused ATPase/permease subunit
MNIIRKTIHIVGKENKKGLIFLILINLLNFFLEFISLISIPLFTAALLGNEINLKGLDSSLSFLNHDKILIYTTLLVILSFLFKNLLMAYNAYFQANYLKKIRTILSKKFFNHYFNAKNIDKIGLKPSIMARNVTHVVQGFYGYCENLNKLVKELVATITIAVIISFLNIKISLLLILFFILILFFYFSYLGPKIRKKAKQNQEIISNFNKIIFETFEAIKEIKVYQKEKIVSKIFEKKVENFERNFFFFSVFDKFPRILLEVITIFSILAVSIIIINYSSDIFQELPLLSLIIVSAIRMIPAFSGISACMFYLRAFSPSVEIAYNQFKEIESSEIEEKTIFNGKRNYQKDLDIKSNYLILDNISFSYEQDKKLINNINIKIPKNSFVSIVGPSGSGKTTLQSIIMGLIKPDQGNIFFENQNIQSIKKNWMKKISYVSQKVFLFDDSIKKNICLSFDGGEIDEKKLETAIEIAELKEKINSLKDGLDENVGTDGNNLSGGERQRVALARAIYKKAEVIFLDEFTSNLDLETEKKIMTKIKNNLPDTTIIMITHRLETAKTSDIIINIEKNNQ